MLAMNNLMHNSLSTCVSLRREPSVPPPVMQSEEEPPQEFFPLNVFAGPSYLPLATRNVATPSTGFSPLSTQPKNSDSTSKLILPCNESTSEDPELQQDNIFLSLLM